MSEPSLSFLHDSVMFIVDGELQGSTINISMKCIVTAKVIPSQLENVQYTSSNSLTTNQQILFINSDTFFINGFIFNF